MTIGELNEKHGFAGHLEFAEGKGGLTVITVDNQYASATISLYGAHVLSFQPKGEKELLWMSENSFFEAGKPIRGGIPVCFPWFGPHADDSTKPQHGFARLLEWEVTETATMENGATLIRLSLHHSVATIPLWPHAFSAVLAIIVGESLDVKLSVTNSGPVNLEYSDALHTYLNVSDISKINIDGLGNTSYNNGVTRDLKIQEEGLLAIDKETNRRYINHSEDCIISDSGFNRKIRVSKTGSKVTVVWNPGADIAKTIPDMADDGYKTFVCVEAVNLYPDIDLVKLAPGESFSMSTTVDLI